MERVRYSSRQVWASVHAGNGADELVFRTALHVLVQAGAGTAAFAVDHPSAQLVYAALAVPLHSVGVPGAGCVQRQQFTAFAVYGAS